MAYLDTRKHPSPASMAAVIAIHGAVGAALVFGLSVTGVIEKREIFAGFQVDPPKPPPPPKPTEPQPKSSATRDPKIVVPLPPIDFKDPSKDVITTTDPLPPLPPLPPGPGEGTTKVDSTPAPTFTPVAARPRSNPANWVTTDDYRSNWIRQEMTGKARFQLEIATDGRVTNCTITESSGHPQLDAATCALVSKRARFNPAQGKEGEPVAGNYSNAIDWQLPK